MAANFRLLSRVCASSPTASRNAGIAVPQSGRGTGEIDPQQKFVALQSRRSTSELSRAAKRLRLNELLGRTGRASDGRDQRISLKARLAANGFVNIAPHTEAVRLPA